MSAKMMKITIAGWALAVLALLPAAGRGEDMPPDYKPTSAPESGAFAGILQTGCSSCGAGILGASGPSYLSSGGCSDGSCEGGCFPGRKNCTECVGTNCVSRMFCAFHDCLCCPDPCYEGRWIAAANSAFFVDGARPVSQMRLRWDYGNNLVLPDRSEYFWGKIGGGRGPSKPETRVNYSQLTIYNEAATERFSVFTEMPYLSLNNSVNPGAAGFGDLKVGTKSMLLDCELIQLSFQFTTSIPVGNSTKGLGTGHVSLEPSLIAAIKLYPDTYLQAQISQWCPIAGSDFAGGVLHYHFSLNHVICRPVGDTQLVGTLEFNGYSFESGAYTDPVLGRQASTGTTYASIGPGIRYIICDKVDFGFGAAFAVTDPHFANQLFRTEFRWRF